MSVEKILIAGFSGAGKSSLLKELEFASLDNSWSFNDLDQLVIKKHKKEIPELINELGWEKFRLWERQEFESWLKEDGKGVLSLGGGALSQMMLNLYGIQRKVKILYLHASFEDCWERLNLDGADERPLIKLGKGELHRIYLERQKIFSQIEWKLDNSKGSDLEELAKGFWEKIKISNQS